MYCSCKHNVQSVSSSEHPAHPCEHSQKDPGEHSCEHDGAALQRQTWSVHSEHLAGLRTVMNTTAPPCEQDELWTAHSGPALRAGMDSIFPFLPSRLHFHPAPTGEAACLLKATHQTNTVKLLLSLCVHFWIFPNLQIQCSCISNKFRYYFFSLKNKSI